MEVTFSGNTATAAKDLVLSGAAFGMAGVDSSSNVYPAALTNGQVKVIELPTVSSTDLPGYYLTGQEQNFHIQTNNPATGLPYSRVLFKITIEGAEATDITSAQYEQTYPSTSWKDFVLLDTGADLVTWYGMAEYGGFNMPAPDDQGLQNFRIIFANAGVYPVHIELWEMDGAVGGTLATGFDMDKVNLLAEKSYDMVAYNTPVITQSGLTGNHQGLTQSFTLNFNNLSAMTDPYTGAPITFVVTLNLPSGTVLTLPGGGTVTCDVNGCTFPVTLIPGANAIALTATFPAPFSGSVTVSLYDSFANPDRLLKAETFSPVVVYANIASVTGTISMEGRSFRGGAQMILTGPTTGTDPVVLFPYGPHTATSVNQISNNLTFANLAGTTYTITTFQPRYLNITAALGKFIVVDTSPEVIAQLKLKGGNANWIGNNVIDVNDASLVGTQYGGLGSTDLNINHGDVNFDNIVNVLDLALVGGNFDLQSDAPGVVVVDGVTFNPAYPTWVP